MEISKEFTIEAAHRLPNVPPGHKCERLHGHSFCIEVWVTGEPDPETGWIMDYSEIDDAFQPIFDRLDHNYMNDIEGLSNPTSENLARFVWQRLAPSLTGLSKIVIRETCNTACVYHGPDESR